MTDAQATETTEKKPRVKRTWRERAALLRESAVKALAKAQEREVKAKDAWELARSARFQAEADLKEAGGDVDPDMLEVVQKVVGDQPIPQELEADEDDEGPFDVQP